MNVVLVLAALFAAQPVVTTPVQPSAITAADFLSRAQALIQSGRASGESPELDVLRGKISLAGRLVRTQQREDRQAGRPATYCIPESAAADAVELLGFLTSIPAEQRNMPFPEAFSRYVRSKYPCSAR